MLWEQDELQTIKLEHKGLYIYMYVFAIVKNH